MRFYLRILITIMSFSLSFSLYQIGDQISETDQDRKHEICYGAEHHGFEEDGHGQFSLSLSDFNGFRNNTGIFYVTMIDMAASW